MYDNITDALRRGAADEAMALAREAVTQQPEDAQAYRMLAAAQRLAGEVDASLETIDRAIELDPENADLHLERAGALLRTRRLDQAEQALAQSSGLDPNLFPAYTLQAQLALGRGDFEEAQRLTRTAGRIHPDHPHVAALEGTLALRRGDAERAMGILSEANRRYPGEPVLQHALGFAYFTAGHFAFAEQAFRQLRETQADSLSIRILLAQLMARQGRPGDALDELGPMLERPGSGPALQRLAGELALGAGRNAEARELLLRALHAEPGDRRTLSAMLEAWRRLDASDEARKTLDDLLAGHPRQLDLWQARLAIEAFAGPEAREIVQRWREADPESVPALMAAITIHDAHGEREDAAALARQVNELDPNFMPAQTRTLEALLDTDPAAAVAHAESLVEAAANDQDKRDRRRMLGRTFDLVGDYGAAATTWAGLHADVAGTRFPLPPRGKGGAELPALAPRPAGAPLTAFLWGAPGSLYERFATTLALVGAPLKADRFGATPPADLFQRFRTPEDLESGQVAPAAAAQEWREALPARGVRPGGPLIDLLLWWDNSMLHVLRPHVPEGVLLVALRDPRDMLLDWLAWGTAAPYALPDAEQAAQWLSGLLEQVAELHEGDLYPHRLLRLDGIEDDPEAIASLLSQALDVRVGAVPPERLGGRRLASGHWRNYSQALAPAFAVLGPVAQRLGYPAA